MVMGNRMSGGLAMYSIATSECRAVRLKLSIKGIRYLKSRFLCTRIRLLEHTLTLDLFYNAAIMCSVKMAAANLRTTEKM
ncbi:hypothetical protein NDU88_000705 [Pleurodeles waltl]|uniref:Uncharacterized protein n=1 Tax=Pleurodeles waltl TaxID=8319 RepID=A0AAV7MMT5_PLEWA|nr:hypothetical protein NDU88_000705 [Pleurodeles waltl]